MLISMSSLRITILHFLVFPIILLKFRLNFLVWMVMVDRCTLELAAFTEECLYVEENSPREQGWSGREGLTQEMERELINWKKE